MNDCVNSENWLRAEVITCPNCAEKLYRVDHSPMLDCHILYCSECANSVEVDYYDPIYSSIYKTMSSVGSIQYQELMHEIEIRLNPCSCGGLFRHNAARRCHNCRAEVIADELGVDLFPGFFGIDIGERDPTDEELEKVHSFEAKHVRRKNIWK